MSCVSSLLVSCFFNGSSLADKKIVSATVPYITDTPTKGEIAETEILQWITHDESDPDENYDYYGDITLGPITGYKYNSTILTLINEKYQNEYVLILKI